MAFILMVSDKETTVQFLKQRVERFVRERDWDVYHHPKELAISIAIEAAELLEIFQWIEKQPKEDIKRDEKVMSQIKDELADVINYCIGLANQLGIDISDSVVSKIEKNETRYPVARVRGKAREKVSAE
ncbi:MAG: nucleotide pyrophosphohydrolase [Candidatus Altiarchaeota archaeon]|nr:nucleotide pyrophosphohydrolase [Candidatus Altiarchaeota archaeon]